jgi:hypothetical protein
MAEYFRKFPRYGGGRAIWTGNDPASVLLRNEFFGIPPAPPPSGSNPSTIMGAGNVLWYGDAAQPGLGQNIDGTGAVSDGDPVRFLPGLEGDNAVATAVGRNVIYRDNSGDPYLEAVAGSSNLRVNLSRSGDFYTIIRGRWNGTGGDRERFFIIHENATQWYVGDYFTPNNEPFGVDIEIGTSVGSPVATTQTIARNTWSTLEVYVSGSTVYTAVDGGTFEADSLSSAFPSTTILDLFGALDGGSVNASFALDIARGAVLSAIPDSTQRAELLTWATDGDTGGGSAVDVAPGVGSVAVAGVAPTVAAAASMSPGVGAVAITGLAPTVTAGAGVTVEPGVGAVAIAGLAPVVAAAATASVPVGSVAITGLAPTVTAAAAAAPGVGSVAIDGLAPSVVTGAGVTVAPGVGSVAVAGLAPALAANSIVLPGVGAVVLSGLAPAVTAAAILSPGVGSVSILGIAPAVDVGGGGGGEIGRNSRFPVGLLPTGRMMGQ